MRSDGGPEGPHDIVNRVRFGPFEADLTSGELRRDGQPIPIQDLPFRLLTALLERPGELVTRTELTGRLWGAETYVDAAAGLNTAIAKLREALGDAAERPVWVETVPKRGYRFIGPLEPAAPTGAAIDAPSSIPEPQVAAGRWRAAAVLGGLAIAVAAAYALGIGRSPTRVAVVLFDNETGRPEFGRLSQGLTDATVFELTAQPSLAVIGNAAILRTTRPFRDIDAIRDALHADFIVIGQVQLVDDRILVRSHLIRASDQAHVWVKATRMTSTEAGLLSDVARDVSTAVANARLGRLRPLG